MTKLISFSWVKQLNFSKMNLWLVRESGFGGLWIHRLLFAVGAFREKTGNCYMNLILISKITNTKLLVYNYPLAGKLTTQTWNQLKWCWSSVLGVW